MKTIKQIKLELEYRQSRLHYSRRNISRSMKLVKDDTHQVITHPAALAIAFGCGWLVDRRRPPAIKEVKNAQIKTRERRFSVELLKIAAPFILAQFRAETGGSPGISEEMSDTTVVS
ncbi:MAG: hypothetical protein DHS20C01_02560 [marine bacterium B5-7]|nr:MAG: hypothetical protein DHS20C01_02560 [marine bacterium B5-7]